MSDDIQKDGLESIVAAAIATELERLANHAESVASWTENNVLPGPNSDYTIRHYREVREWLLEEASDWKNGYYPKDFTVLQPQQPTQEAGIMRLVLSDPLVIAAHLSVRTHPERYTPAEDLGLPEEAAGTSKSVSLPEELQIKAKAAAAARIRVAYNEKIGKPTPKWVEELAEFRLEDETP